MWTKYFVGGEICFQVFFRGNIFSEVLPGPHLLAYRWSPEAYTNIFIYFTDPLYGIALARCQNTEVNRHRPY